MTQTAAKPESTGTQAVVAAVHYQGDRWRLVVLSSRSGASLEQAVSLDAESQIPPLLQQYKVQSLIRIAPSRETVARCSPVPAGANGELAGALALIAEAQLPETIAPHRRAAGTIPESGSAPARSALLVGWKGEPPGSLAGDDVEEQWTTPAAALAVLRQGCGQSAVYADPDEGAMSLLVFGNKTLARVLVEDAPNATSFARTVSNIVGETCTAAGVTPPSTLLGQSGIVLSIDAAAISAARTAVKGVPDQRSWFEQYGLALGAAMMALAKDPLIRGLATIRAAAPTKRESPVEKVANWLTVPKRAWGLLAAALLLLLLGPWAIASGRLMILDSKAVGLGDRTAERAAAAKRAALYRQLDSTRWPMAKLLADISAAIPVGVTTESIRLAPDQGLAIDGSAENADLVNTMQANLVATKLLKDVKLNRVTGGGSGVVFDLTASIENPHIKASGVEDFATKPLAVRLYGEGASNTTLPKNTSPRDTSPAVRETRSTRASSDRPERSGGGGGGGGGGDRPERGERTSRASEAPSRPAATPPGEAPAPISDDQIAKLDKNAAMKEWVARKTFPQRNPTLDAPTKSRLEDEVRKLKEQMDKATAK